MPRISQCRHCQCNAHSLYLVCAIHPEGVDNDCCPDYVHDPNAEELWQPVGAAYGGDKLILQPELRWSDQQILELLDWHPLFTGQCPNCEVPMAQTTPRRIHWDCSECGWKDNSV